jgi:Skp family chaperone for outer membrane proteins
MFWRKTPKAEPARPVDPLFALIERVRELQSAQRDIMARRAALKDEARDVQDQLDSAQAELAVLRKDVARETGVKIGPVSIPSAEQFGTP